MRYKNHFLLLLTAFIWGCAFVAQSAGMDYVGPFTFTALRSYLGGLVLLPLNSIYLSYPVTWVVTAAAHLITYMILRKKAFN